MNVIWRCKTVTLLAIGARFDDRVIGNPAHFSQNPRKIIHIDIDPSSISKRVKVDMPIVGNIEDVTHNLIDELTEFRKKGLEIDHDALGKWWDEIELWRKKRLSSL